MRLLVVTAVAGERDAAVRGLRGARDVQEHLLPGGRSAASVQGAGVVADVLAAGVGPGAAAAGTAAALAHAPYDIVICAGIAGGFAPAARVGSVVVADAIIAADLGSESPDGFIPVADLGFGTSRHLPPAALSRAVADALGAGYGTVLTLSTMTGTAGRAAELAARHPSVLAEAMEGFGVAEAAAAHRLPVLEIRAISNPVGPRDRASWRIGDALTALTDAFGKLTPALEQEAAP
ncbi:futalosine hydrolase [Streptomyces sp. RB6PN25]|uniref:Futalosine hydrolase n=1 Tax=Streptomyces humicola TaxID=2953240 RepID=A0ABT1PUQ8_9ACTN|nr:futalosine hydrolase [Streptomyces humicola]MCQ4081405.1 futalosine hydrolase [Streptomyces humicola]